jgi:hypothetical protein
MDFLADAFSKQDYCFERPLTAKQRKDMLLPNAYTGGLPAKSPAA